MTEKLYQTKCIKCDSETPHRIKLINVKRGVKLECLVCGLVMKRYRNLKKLKEYVKKNVQPKPIDKSVLNMIEKFKDNGGENQND